VTADEGSMMSGMEDLQVGNHEFRPAGVAGQRLASLRPEGDDLLVRGDVEVLRLEPGDVVVLTVPDDRRIPPDRVADAKALLEEKFPGHEVLVVMGAKLSLVRTADGVEGERT